MFIRNDNYRACLNKEKNKITVIRKYDRFAFSRKKFNGEKPRVSRVIK